MYDLLIKNTKVIDGSGAPAFSGTIAVKEGKLYVLPSMGGMCGSSMFPVNPRNLHLLQESLGILVEEFPEEMPNFTTCEKYLAYTDTVKRPENTQFMVGHVTLRVAVMGYDDRAPSPEEMEEMKRLLREAMEHGSA